MATIITLLVKGLIIIGLNLYALGLFAEGGKQQLREQIIITAFRQIAAAILMATAAILMFI